MAILDTLFNMENTNGASGIPLIIPLAQIFSFDLDIFTEDKNSKSSVFWNFGDPDSTDNEIVCSSITGALVRHIYTFPGNYHIHAIANINGVYFHTEQFISISPQVTANVIVDEDSGAILYDDVTGDLLTF